MKSQSWTEEVMKEELGEISKKVQECGLKTCNHEIRREEEEFFLCGEKLMALEVQEREGRPK